MSNTMGCCCGSCSSHTCPFQYGTRRHMLSELICRVACCLPNLSMLRHFCRTFLVRLLAYSLQAGAWAWCHRGTIGIGHVAADLLGTGGKAAQLALHPGCQASSMQWGLVNFCIHCCWLKLSLLCSCYAKHPLCDELSAI